jgi:hypothetical protein
MMGKWSDLHGHPIMIPRGHWGINMVIAYLVEMWQIKQCCWLRRLNQSLLSWFEQNQQLDNGFIYVIGRILYDPEYNKQLIHESLTNQRIQYDYMVPEAIRSPLVARSLGLNFLDSTCIAGQNYTYNVSFKDSLGTLYQSEISVNLDWRKALGLKTNELSLLNSSLPVVRHYLICAKILMV